MAEPNILIVDDDLEVALAAKLILKKLTSRIEIVAHPEQLARKGPPKPDVVLLDLNFSPGRTDGAEGLEALAKLRSLPQPPAVIAITAYADVPLAVEALKRGAADFITKPWNDSKLSATVAAAIAQDSHTYNHDVDAHSTLLGSSRSIQDLRALVASVAPTDASVLILGENGVGKELVAREIHRASRRSDQIFLTVDMGALPESTFESELFGHRQGAFTDARVNRAGRFQTARGGTLFLDEIGNMSLVMQAKLLTAVERREVTPVGADRAEPVDVRIISATNMDEASLYNPQVFRTDLLFRLNTIVIRVPPLREHRNDIPLLARHYLDQYAAQYQRPMFVLGADAEAEICAHLWPGNVRALRHACERAVILARGPEYAAADFGIHPDLNGAAEFRPETYERDGTTCNLDAREREAVATALTRSNGNISQAAKLLGISRSALYRRREKHGL